MARSAPRLPRCWNCQAQLADLACACWRCNAPPFKPEDLFDDFFDNPKPTKRAAARAQTVLW